MKGFTGPIHIVYGQFRHMHSRRLTVASCAAAAALALSARGVGSRMATNVADNTGGGNTGGGSRGGAQMSLLDKWQRFHNGNPTLGMTGAGHLDVAFHPDRPFNDLPPASETETRAILSELLN